MRRKNKTLFLVIMGFVFLILADRIYLSSYPKTAADQAAQPVATTTAGGGLENKKSAGTSSPEILPAEKISPEYYPVIKVVDGDTIDILLNGKSERLRLIGINTPETVDPNKPVECFGPQASANAHKLLDGQEVRIAADPTQDDKDMYGRLLRYVWRQDGLFYNLEAIKDGFAYEYTFAKPYQYQAEFKAAQQAAQAANLGLWSACAGTISVQPQVNTASGSSGSQCLIKGNINSSGVKIYELPNCPYYKQTVIDTSKGEKWFCTEAAALAAGWRKAGNCP
jgi:micrococcal nuclease